MIVGLIGAAITSWMQFCLQASVAEKGISRRNQPVAHRRDLRVYRQRRCRVLHRGCLLSHDLPLGGGRWPSYHSECREAAVTHAESNKRPLSVTLLGCAYLAVGAGGMLAHFPGFHSWRYDDLLVEFTELLALLGGALILTGKSRARWLAVAWMAFHVILSAFHSAPETALHGFFLALIVWVLFRPAAARYFRPVSSHARTALGD